MPTKKCSVVVLAALAALSLQRTGLRHDHRSLGSRIRHGGGQPVLPGERLQRSEQPRTARSLVERAAERRPGRRPDRRSRHRGAGCVRRALRIGAGRPLRRHPRQQPLPLFRSPQHPKRHRDLHLRLGHPRDRGADVSPRRIGQPAHHGSLSRQPVVHRSGCRVRAGTHHLRSRPADRDREPRGLEPGRSDPRDHERRSRAREPAAPRGGTRRIGRASQARAPEAKPRP